MSNLMTNLNTVDYFIDQVIKSENEEERQKNTDAACRSLELVRAELAEGVKRLEELQDKIKKAIGG